MAQLKVMGARFQREMIAADVSAAIGQRLPAGFGCFCRSPGLLSGSFRFVD
jgi:hypothetical protein